MKPESGHPQGKQLALGIAIVLAFLVWQGVKNQIGDIRPALTPAPKAKTGPTVDIPFTLPQGFKIGTFAANLGKARDLQFTPAGTLLVSSQNQGKVIALPDKNEDGMADQNRVVISALRNVHGMAFYKGQLYVAEETSVRRYNWDEVELSATKEKKILDLPAGGRHVTRSLAFDTAGRLYVSIGSSCDVCVEEHPWVGTVIQTDPEGRQPRVFARGLRNAVFLASRNEKIWTTEMGRDFLGDNLPPDEINLLSEGDFGWPRCYGNRVQDTSFDKTYRALGESGPCADTIAPLYEIPAHSAPLGLTFINSQQMPPDWDKDLLVAYHGSWNRSTPTGYKIVRLKVEGDKVLGSNDFITGFLQGSRALGRPVDMAFDNKGSLYISDDAAGAVYKMVRE